MKEIVPGIVMITEPRGLMLGELKPAVNLYALAGPDGLLFDAGYGDRRSVGICVAGIRAIEDRYRSQGRTCRFTRVLPSHTHQDHFPGMVPLRETLGLSILLTPAMARVVCSEDAFRAHYRVDEFLLGDAAKKIGTNTFRTALYRMEGWYYRHAYGMRYTCNPDQLIDERESLSINGENWRVLPCPGHAEDHIALYNRERGIVLAGDTVLNSINTWLGPPRSSLGDYLHTLAEIRALPKLELILGGHGDPVYNPREKIDALIAWRNRRTGQVLDCIQNAGKAGIGVVAIMKRLYGWQDWRKRLIARGWIQCTVGYLEAEGVIERVHDPEPARYRIIP